MDTVADAFALLARDPAEGYGPSPAPDLMTDREHARLSRRGGDTFVAWELFDRWLVRWRADHPDDARDELKLLAEVYGPLGPNFA